ncbi:MAG: SIR2 family protein [Pseudonocardiales bacterium]|nr:SIR2 family protein [Pseudonocardiales bacterium]MBV9032702.1 SIR2 family protein [Pseudonocardiales bacterium]
MSAPLYPLWAEVISELIDTAADRLTEEEARACRVLATGNPNAVVDIVRERVGTGDYQETLRKLFAPRKDPSTQRSWTHAQELVARCNFAGVVTTNYDPGIANARMAVRVHASATGFASWDDCDLLIRWRQGTVFADDALPVLFAHGHHNRPESIVLATTEYRRAYRDRLGAVLGQLLDTRRVVWIGFSFTDRRIETVLQEIGDHSITRLTNRPAARHVAVLSWDPAAGPDPGTVRLMIEIQFGCRVVLYPAPEQDHSALGLLLAELTDPRYPPVSEIPVEATLYGDDKVERSTLVERWVHGPERIRHFTGRVEELARLTRWARDPEVRLVGVTAWGGAGKTALVTEWLARRGGARQRPAVRGVFAWNFYQRNSVEEWGAGLLFWVARKFRLHSVEGPLAVRVLAVLRVLPLVLVLDGLEVTQEGPAGGQFGRLLDGTLRAVLTGACQCEHAGLLVLTSRFPFADLEQFDGGTARMMDVPPFTAEEGATMLAAAGGGWLPESERLELVQAMDGHALAVGVLAGALADRPPAGDLQALRRELLDAGRTDARVGKVLRFYADLLDDAERALVALVALFQRPVPIADILTLGGHDSVGAQLSVWTPARVETAARVRLSGLLSWHPDGTLSAHPLVRDAFRPFVLTGDLAELAADTTLTDLPGGGAATRDQALRVVEMVELLLDANQWDAANRLYHARLGGKVLKDLPAAQLGQRCAMAFVGTSPRQATCQNKLGARSFAYYLNAVGFMSMLMGDPSFAAKYLNAAAGEDLRHRDTRNLSIGLRNFAVLAVHLGDTDASIQAATQAHEAAAATNDQEQLAFSRAHLGWANDLAGATLLADDHYTAADAIHADTYGRHLCSLYGTTWAALLARTGRVLAAYRLMKRNEEICDLHGWRASSTRCARERGRCELIDGDLDSAGLHLVTAAEFFRDGDYLVEWADTLPDLAEHRRRIGELDDAERLCAEAVTAAGPRGLVPAHARALATRALVRGDRFAGTGDRDQLERARDDAEHALRLATRAHRLPWQELKALHAHAHLDQLDGQDRGWRAKADQLHAALVPPGLGPGPLAPS